MNRVKLVDIASDAIIEMIHKKEYDQYGYLPSEGDLAIQLDVSRSTIREAVRSLEVRGFLHRRHGKGLEVANNSIDVITRSLEDMILKEEDILNDLLEIRMVLEPVCANLAATRATAQDLVDMQNFIDIMLLETSTDEEYYKADLDFHITLARASRNRIYLSMITAYTPILLKLIEETTEIRHEPVHHYHQKILEAVKSRDGELAEKQMWIHLQTTNENLEGAS